MPLPDWSANVIVPRVVPFKTALWAVAAQDGCIAEIDGLPVELAHQIAGCISRAYKYALEFYDWPEAALYTQVTLGQHPQWDVPFVPRVMPEGFPPFAFPIFEYGRLYGVWTANPAADPSARPLTYRFGPDGLYLDEEVESVVLHHRQGAPRFSAEEWNVASTYPRGKVIYHPDTEHCYLMNTAAPGEVPVPFSDSWRVLPILSCLLEPTIEGAFALLKRSQGQAGTAAVLQDAMQHLLEQEILQFTNQEQQTKFAHFS